MCGLLDRIESKGYAEGYAIGMKEGRDEEREKFESLRRWE